jgi:GTP-binding protein LepA
VDFTYEVSRSLAACEGAILVVDASQGIQAQTLSNLFLAMDAGLEIIPMLNKIDLPGAEPEKRRQEVVDLIGCSPRTSSSCQRQGRPRHPRAARGDRGKKVPPPRGNPDGPLRALIFDSYYDKYRGAIPSVRVVDGAQEGHEDHLRRLRVVYEVLEVGYAADAPGAGQAAHRRRGGLRGGQRASVKETRAGDTIFDAENNATEALPGYQAVRSFVFAGIFPPTRSSTRPARRAGEAAAQRRLAELRARDLHRAGLRLPLRLPRPAAHGDRAGTARARVRPRPRHHGAERGVPRDRRPTARMELVENPALMPPAV